MFFHNYKYRLKCLVRDKVVMFWTLLFPIILAVLFNLAFSNISSANDFNFVDIAVVKGGEYDKNQDFIESLKSSSESNSDSALFRVEYTSKEIAQDMLDNNKITGYIFFENGINVVVKGTGINETILKSFVDGYIETSATIKTVVENNPMVLLDGQLNSLLESTDYMKDVPVSNADLDYSVNYFYTLIAMACLYGAFLGLKEVQSIQANQSAQGARINTASTNKRKIFMASVAAATTVQIVDIGILLAFLTLVLKINFGNQLGYIILTCIVGSITGVTFGTCISSIIKKGEGVKIGVVIGFTMTMSFLAGMMYDGMKYIVNTTMPILAYLNPVNLIADSFYSLYYYDTTTKFFTNIVLLCVFSIVFSIITYFVIRRQKYASL